MTMTAITNSNPLGQAWAAQQASASGAADPDSSEDGFEAAASGSACGVSSPGLTGGTTGTLDSQTLQALLDLTQTDPSDGSASQSQAQGAMPRHHHRHHGVNPSTVSSGDGSTIAANAASGSGDETPANDASGDLAAQG